MKKSDVEFHSYLPYGGPPNVPAVNVKVHNVYGLERYIPEIANEQGMKGFTLDWWDRNVSDNDLEHYFQFACEVAWEDAQMFADECGLDGQVYSAGRSGGWAYVQGLPDFDTWDAIMLGRWARWSKWVRALADDVPRAMVWSICANMYDAAMEAETARIEESATLAVR